MMTETAVDLIIESGLTEGTVSIGTTTATETTTGIITTKGKKRGQNDLNDSNDLLRGQAGADHVHGNEKENEVTGTVGNSGASRGPGPRNLTGRPAIDHVPGPLASDVAKNAAETATRADSER